MKNPPADLTTFLGDCEVALSGTFQPAEPDVNLGNGYSLEKVWLVNDMTETDIITLLSEEQIERLEDFACYTLAERRANLKQFGEAQ